MNLESPQIPATTPQSEIPDKDSASIHAGVRVEPCEFEDLLRRAMEILDTRARAATNDSKT